MKCKVEKTENANEVKLELTIEAQKFEEGIKKVYFQSAKYFNIPGFRKGKAPMNIVEKYYGKEIFYEDAFNEVVPDELEEALKENNIEVVSKADIDVKQIEKGKDLIEKELKRIGIPYAELFKTDYINPMLERYKYKNLDEMYLAVGFGAITANRIIARMLIEYRKEHKEEPKIEEKIEELAKNKVDNTKVSDSGVIVKGIDNCLVKLSKCCNPLPGDEIIGYITKGRGVSVHRKDCPNVADLLKEQNRIIDVKWYNDEKKSSYTVEIEIFANDRNGLLGDIVQKLNDSKVRLISVNAKATKERIAITEVTLEVDSVESLNKVIRELRKIDSVYEVSRKNKMKE